MESHSEFIHRYADKQAVRDTYRQTDKKRERETEGEKQTFLLQ